MSEEKTTLPPKQLEAVPFNQAMVRIERSERIANDLRPKNGEPYSRTRVQEVRDIEMKSRQGDAANETELEELVIDTRDYQEKRFAVTYISEYNKQINEELVMFVKIGKDGQPEWLMNNGKVMGLNANLYDARLTSRLHSEYNDHKATVIPRIGGNGAYTGVVSIIENQKGNQESSARNNQDTQLQQEEPSVKAIPPATPDTARTTLAHLSGSKERQQQVLFEEIAAKLSIDTDRPKKPENFFPPMGGNMFGEDDEPTLAGRVGVKVYTQLVERLSKEPPSKQRSDALYELNNKGSSDYVSYLNQLEEKRKKDHKPHLTYAVDRPAGTDGFHFGGSIHTKEFMYYFNKSKTHWKHSGEPEVRAYLTLDPKDAPAVQKHFVDLASILYDEGIDFSGKSAGALGMDKRTDNMVFYIAGSDQVRASELIKKFMTEKGLGQGHVMAAIPSPQDGLSWAGEPDKTQEKIWQKVSGSSQKASFNSYIASMVLPTYMDRLAAAHEKKGDYQSASQFRQEATRVRKVISEEMHGKS